MNKKQTVISQLYAQCKERGDFTFDNDEVRAVAREVGFGNAFDATKWDNSAKLPDALKDDDVFVVHLGEGRHKFVSGIGIGYHKFEPITDEQRYRWPYRSSMLNNINTSESNILSVGYNQRIIHDFLYADIVASPKVYGSHRTQLSMQYCIAEDQISANSLQVEIDYTTEYLGVITVFEAKNGKPSDFNVFQLFGPFCYYSGLRESRGLEVESVNCCYLIRQKDKIRLYLYYFTDINDPGSIKLLQSAEYTLVRR